MDLVFALQDDRTILRDAYCEIPFKVTRVLNSHRPVAHLILMHCTAGLFGGDDIQCSIRLEPGARVMITQQSATKIHRSLGPPAIQRTNIFVDSDAVLQLCLEPIIPFAGSVLRQTTQIDVQAGGRLVFWESFMAGRIGSGECWQFRELSSETELRLNNRLVYIDRFRLPNGLEGSPHVMGISGYVGTGLYVGSQTSTITTGLQEAIPEAGIDAITSNVAAVRVVTDAGPELQRYRDIFRHWPQ
jgi:urease accessory protein